MRKKVMNIHLSLRILQYKETVKLSNYRYHNHVTTQHATGMSQIDFNTITSPVQ